MNHVINYFQEVIQVAQQIDIKKIDELANNLKLLRDRGGRLFILGVGGSAGNASHAVNDFRKLCGIESYAPTDNVSELTARTNDEGWSTIFSGWLKVSKINKSDAILVFSVGGGDLDKNVSPNLVSGLSFAKEKGLKIFGIVGRDGGYTNTVGDCVVIVPTVDQSRVTPHTEAFHAVVWHCLVSHPILQITATKW